MVNVNSQFPFNLHNQRLDEPSPSRSSRNVSGGTYGSSHHASPSPRPSLKKSHSSISIHPDQEEDLFSSQVLAPNGNRLPAILNVRLVRTERPTGGHGPTYGEGCTLSHEEQPGRSGFSELNPSLPPGLANETLSICG
ncbi:hypothetical protein EDC04DRAFT_1524518 [Pisolithus marmoratus]|nr:hypothetical protein EDC04DRAFT_1524518 [Pisolithus marmoratus]